MWRHSMPPRRLDTVQYNKKLLLSSHANQSQIDCALQYDYEIG